MFLTAPPGNAKRHNRPNTGSNWQPRSHRGQPGQERCTLSWSGLVLRQNLHGIMAKYGLSLPSGEKANGTNVSCASRPPGFALEEAGQFLSMARDPRTPTEAITPSAARKIFASSKLTPKERPRNFPFPARVRIPSTSPSLEMTGLPADGSNVYATLYTRFSSSGQWVKNSYVYTAFNSASAKGVITTPVPGSTLSGSSVAFTWSAGTGATAYWLDVGSTVGGNQYYQSGNLGNVLATTANGLPTDGSTVYVTLYSQVGGQWLSNAYTYTAYNASGARGVITTPTPGSTFTGSTVTFDWTAGAGASAYWLDIGNVPGGNQYFQSGNLGNVLTVTVNGLPMNGSTVYVTLYSLVGGQWVANAYTYTAFNGSSGLGAMRSEERRARTG